MTRKEEKLVLAQKVAFVLANWSESRQCERQQGTKRKNDMALQFLRRTLL